MTDRRRNIFILLFVAGLVIASIAVIATKQTRLGLDLQGGVELVYEASPTPQQPVVDQAALDRAIDVMRERVDRLGVAEPEIQRSGENQISVALPDVQDADKAQRQVGQVAQLFFYDWETNVIGPDGEVAPDDPEVTGGPSAGRVGGISYYDAVVRASEQPAAEGEAAKNVSHDGLYFLLDQKKERVVGGPEEEKQDLFSERPDDAEAPDCKEGGESTLCVETVQPGTTIVRAEQADDQAEIKDPNNAQYYVLRDRVALKGTDIKNPEQQFDQGAGGSGQPIVTFDFTDSGRKTWEEVTRGIAQRGLESFAPGSDPQSAAQHFAIVLDNELVSVPFIDFQQNPDGIDGRNGSQIEGGFTIESAQELANLLKTGALPVKLDLISQSQISASLGQQALDQSLIAAAAGMFVVALFLLIFYRVLGVIAVGALGIYALLLFALIKMIPIVMTLPGIAGLVLTIGVAADANIVIFERVKEEIRAGRSVQAGIAAGYRKGLTAIIDANVVTVMVAFILFVLATAGVKGFAFTLGVGTIVSFLTAVVFTQAILGTMGRSRLLARPSALGAGKPARDITFDFMGASRWFFSGSGVILAIGALAIGANGINFGIDFESGTRIKTAVEKTTNEDGIRAVMSSVGYGDAKIQRVQEPELGENVFQISTPSLEPADVQEVRAALDEEFGVGDEFSNSSIGPTFGETVARTAVIAIIASFLVIAAYIAIRFEWKYAVPLLIAVMHDLLITAGIYALFGFEVTSATVAALLTILGFSLYDTIIVFDRVRENVPRMPRAAFSQIVNRSMSEVIVRSLATSFCTLLPVLALFAFGGETLRSFAVALIVGTISGTYSSVFIASPVLTHWKERERVWRRRRGIIESELGSVPAYATAVGGGPVDVAPTERKRPSRRLTSPDDPQAVSKEEFDAMVQDLHVDAPPTATAVKDDTADADPEDVVMPQDDKPSRTPKKRPRNKRHGRGGR
ncbi:protein translocase subunit SecD [Svornostia abyssi]|uniref:Multifunctional fusion protein n=1 Tax=Svornostia abyssi TaxID=2898438 RepID=A0ABY5PDC3_9ACTN|nr:protein translocase subunit SecD [Parviterribacteraceae bacterium J379]